MTSSEVERLGIELAMPLLEQWAGGRKELIIDTRRMEQREHRQRTIGDYILPACDSFTSCWEVKAEQEFTGNLFIETWSNRTTATGDDGTPMWRKGWIETLETDYMLFVFLNVRGAFKVPFIYLQRWFLHKGNFVNYREVEVKKSREQEQRNKTWGCPVPIADMLKPVCIECFAETDGRWQQVPLTFFDRRPRLVRA